MILHSQGQKINKELRFKPSILAYDADLEINSPVQYAITTGNERGLFYINPTNGSLFLKKEIDLEKETSLIGNIFLLQIQASQVYQSRTINLIIFFRSNITKAAFIVLPDIFQIDNPSKTGYARVEIKVIDINDNAPEFEVDLYNISVVENLPNGFSVLQVIAVDRDQVSREAQ